jgi:hypothetical protein
MGLSTDQLISELRVYTGVDSNELPDADALTILNISWWEVMDKFKFREKESCVVMQAVGEPTGSTVAGNRDYILPGDLEASRIVAILNPNDQRHYELERMSEKEYENVYSEDPTLQAIPTNYVRYSNFVRLYPTPDQDYTITLYYWTRLQDLASNSNLTIPQSWHEIILFGGVWRVYARIGDLQRKASFQFDQQRLIETSIPVEVKEQYDTSRAGVSVPTAEDSLYF